MLPIDNQVSNTDCKPEQIPPSDPDEAKLSPHKPKPKRFGEVAQRITREELAEALIEIKELADNYFKKIVSTKQLDDKQTFGDIDLVSLATEPMSQELFTEIFGNNLKNYYKNGHIISLLLELKIGKTIQVDFIEAENEEDFERKYMYYSLGHSSSMIGMLAKKLNYKYGTAGFFKRYKDSKGQWHDILVTPNLREGLTLLGLSAKEYDNIHNTDDIITWLSSSPFFDSSFFSLSELVSRDREAIARNSSQAYIATKLCDLHATAQSQDYDLLFNTLYPKKFQEIEEKKKAIEVSLNVRPAVI